MEEDGLDLGGLFDATDPLLGQDVGWESSLSNWAGDYVTDMLGRGQALADMPYTPYEGTLTAPISSLQDQAYQGIAGLSVPTGMLDAADMALGVGEKAADMGYDPTMFTSGYEASPYYTGYNPADYGFSYQPGEFDSGFQTTQYGTNYQPGQYDSGFQETQYGSDYQQKGGDYFGTDYAAGLFDDIIFDPTDYAGQVGRWTDEGVAESYMNPFMEQVLNPQLEEIRRQAEITRLNDAARLTAAGAYGGSRQGIMEAEGWDNMARLMNETEGAGYRDAYNTGSGIWKSDEDRMLQALGMGDASNQFAANMQLRAQQAAEQAKQFGAGQQLEAQRLADMSQQFGSNQSLEALRLSDLSRQFGSNQTLREQELADAGNRFLSTQEMEALRLGDMSNQFGANTLLREQEMADSANRYLTQQELESQRLADMSRQFGSQQNMEAQRLSDLARQYEDAQSMEAQRLSEQSNQFSADFGKDLLSTELDAARMAGGLSQDTFDSALRLLAQQKYFGDAERQAIQEGLDADKQQYEYEYMWPYKQTQFLQSLLQDMPLEAQQNYYQPPSSLSQFGSSYGGIMDILDQIFNSGGTTEGDSSTWTQEQTDNALYG